MAEEKGRLKVDCYNITCGLRLLGCEEIQLIPEGNRRKAIKEARRQGWKLTRKHGWVCEACYGRQ